MIRHNPIPCGLNDSDKLTRMPLRHVIRDEERDVMTERLRNTRARHRGSLLAAAIRRRPGGPAVGLRPERPRDRDGHRRVDHWYCLPGRLRGDVPRVR